MMNRWDASDSIFAPIIAAVPPGTTWSGFTNALYAAQESVPTAFVAYTMRKGFKSSLEKRERRIISRGSSEGSAFSERLFLIDVPQDRKLANTFSGQLWEVGLTVLRNGLCTPAVPDDYTTALLQVNGFRLSKGTLEGAPQLALLRHLWAESVRAASPNAIVFGGQTHWHDTWWTETLSAEQAS